MEHGSIQPKHDDDLGLQLAGIADELEEGAKDSDSMGGGHFMLYMAEKLRALVRRADGIELPPLKAA